MTKDTWEISCFYSFCPFFFQEVLWPPFGWRWSFRNFSISQQDRDIHLVMLSWLSIPREYFQLLSLGSFQETSTALPSLQQSPAPSSPTLWIRSSLIMSLTPNPKENELHLSARWKEWTALSLKRRKTRTRKLLTALAPQVCKQTTDSHVVVRVDFNVTLDRK